MIVLDDFPVMEKVSIYESVKKGVFLMIITRVYEVILL